MKRETEVKTASTIRTPVRLNFLIARRPEAHIYQQAFVDTYAKLAFAKLYTPKTSIAAADLLIDSVLPFYQDQQVPLLRILTDRGSEYCGKVEQHDYQLYLAVNDIDHSARRRNHRGQTGSASASTRRS